MGAKEYSIAFAIAGKLSGSFGKSFANANETVNAFSRQLEALNKDSASMEGLIKLREEVSANARSVINATKKFKGMQAQSDRLNAKTEDLSKQYASAKRSVTVYANQISKCGVPTRELAEKFARASEKAKALEAELKVAARESKNFAVQTNEAKNALERARATLDRNRSSLREMDSQMGTTGTRMQTLIERQRALATATDKARAAQEKLAAINGKLQKMSEAQVGLKAGAVAGSGNLALMAATATSSNLAMPVKEAMKMEDAMADIAKVANFDTPDGIKNLQRELQKMSLRIPLAVDGLAQIAAAAAQSGIATKDLTAFTEQAAKMAVAFDVSAEAAGTMMSKWKSGMGLTNEETYRLADAVNYLSNNNAALASEIGDTIQRYGALGKVAGLTAEQTAALSASVIAAGATSDTAATGIKAMMRAMGSGGSMSGDQAGAFKNVGIDPKQLQKNLQKDAPQAIMSTLEAIQKKIPKEQWNQYLNAMFGDEAAVAIGPMMQNLDGLRANFERVSDPAKYAGSMLGEFQARAATTSNALTLASNTVKYFAQAVGAPLLDPLKEGATEFVKWGETIGDWVSNNKELVMQLMKVGGAVVGSIAGFHALRIAMYFAVSPMISLYKGFLNVQKAAGFMKNAISLAGGPLKALTLGVRAFGTAMKGLFLNPVGLAILAATALVAAGVAIYKNWDAIKAKVVELWAVFAEKFPNIAALGQLLWNGLKYVFDWLSSAFQSAGGGLQFLGSVFSASFSIMVNAAKVFLGGIVDVFGSIAGIFDNIIGLVKNVFTGQWSAAWENVKGIFSNVFDALAGIAKAPINAVIALVNGAIGAINGISVDIPDWVPKFGGQTFGVNLPTIPQLAEGGIATRSTLANIGEGGEPEAVIPLSKLSSMLGSGVGMRGGITVNFAPVINVSGGSGDAYEGVKRGLDEGRRQLEKDLRRLLADQQRLSFA